MNPVNSNFMETSGYTEITPWYPYKFHSNRQLRTSFTNTPGYIHVPMILNKEVFDQIKSVCPQPLQVSMLLRYLPV